jgi:hypothetical protein
VVRRSRNVLVPVLAALAALTAAPAWASSVLVRDRDGHVHVRQDRFLPTADALGRPRPAGPRAGARAPAARTRPLARAAGTKGPTVAHELSRLQAAGQLDALTADTYRQAYAGAKRTLKKLSGYRRQQLAAVLATTDAMAAARLFTASRLPAVFLTLERNRVWWASSPIPRSGQRVTFAGSGIVWQHYAGQGLQIQWLATFGKANGLWKAKRHDDELVALLDEAIGLAAQRAGGIAFEYLFRFDGGAPPWVSGLAQGTALSALSRATARTGDPKYLDAARAALGIFQTTPPAGVRVPTAAGAHYLQYSFAPQLHILNGFVQALNGLHDFAGIGDDDEGRALFAAGEADLRTELPAFDTGAWSLYSRPGVESDLSYHLLLRDFLAGLCSRLTAQAQREAGRATPYVIPDPALYCDTAQRFTDDASTPPVVTVVAHPLRATRRGSIGLRLSKLSSVTLTVRCGGTAIFAKALRLGYGRHDIPFQPAKAGGLTVDVRAVDPAGNVGTASGELAVGAKPKHKPKR